MRKLADLAQAIGASPPLGTEPTVVNGVSEDSRQIKDGFIFVAISGYSDDGNRYINEAITRGACAIVTEQQSSCPVPLFRVPDSRNALATLSATFFNYPTTKLFTVGVTGTNGKSTVCHLSAHLLGRSDTLVISTVENEARDLQAITTPSNPIIQQLANDALSSKRNNFIVEASSAALSQRRVDKVDFDAAVFTNLTRDHYDLHPSAEAYLQAKLRLFKCLKPEATAIINSDDEVATSFIESSTGRILSYGILHPADIQATSIRCSLHHSEFVLKQDATQIPVVLHLPGRHNVYNALAAVAVARTRGQSLEQIANKLNTAKSLAGRYQFLQATNGTTVVVDFAHSPDALQQMLTSLKPFCKQLICVFGCGGESDTGKRQLMGRISGELAHLTILTTDNPKTEDPTVINDHIEKGLASTNCTYERIPDRKEAIRRALSLTGKNDIVLVAGKGHETYQIIGHNLVPYSDIDFLRKHNLAK